MARHASSLPDYMPVLSRGRHRSMRKGACFMELASVLAGEPWSDHPDCTHPLLSDLARQVNDATTDAGRHHLAELVPEVIGVTGDDPHVDARIAHRCAVVALPVVAAERQNILAVSLLTADRVLAELDGRPDDDLEPGTRQALDSVPLAAAWARSFVGRNGVRSRGFSDHAAPTTIRVAVRGIAEACVPDPDGMLRGLLCDAIAECRWTCVSELTSDHPGLRATT